MAVAIVGAGEPAENASYNRWTLRQFISFTSDKLKLVTSPEEERPQKNVEPTVTIYNRLAWYNPPYNDISTIRYRDLCGIERGLSARFHAMMYLPFADVNEDTGEDGIYGLTLSLPGGVYEEFSFSIETTDPMTGVPCKLRPVDILDSINRGYQINPNFWRFDSSTYFDSIVMNGSRGLRLLLAEDTGVGPSQY